MDAVAGRRRLENTCDEEATNSFDKYKYSQINKTNQLWNDNESSSSSSGSAKDPNT